MFHATTHNETVSRSNIVGLSLACDSQMSPHNVNNLIVRMAVHRADPPFHHFMFNQRELIVIGQHTAFESGFRVRFFRIFIWRHHDWGKSLWLRFDFNPPIQGSFFGSV